jgi:hypothetical protein
VNISAVAVGDAQDASRFSIVFAAVDFGDMHGPQCPEGPSVCGVDVPNEHVFVVPES